MMICSAMRKAVAMALRPVRVEVIAIRADDLFDQAEVTQAFQVSGDAGNGQTAQERFQIGTSDAPDIELGMLQEARTSCSVLSKKLKPLTRCPSISFGVVSLSGSAFPQRNRRVRKEVGVAATTAESRAGQSICRSTS